MKVTYRDGPVNITLDVGGLAFLAFLVRVHRWHSADPDFIGILVTIAGDTVLMQPRTVPKP